jgi:transcription elongation factor GreB
MSKAFLRESDYPDPSDPPPAIPTLAPGTKNYLTAGGAQELRDELAQYLEQARPGLVGQDDPEARRELQALDRKIRRLQQSLRSAEVVSVPPADGRDIVRFGATVTVQEEGAEPSRYRVVGVDETAFGREAISWQSPLAKALLNARLGARVDVPTPAGLRRLTVTRIEYDAGPPG